MTKILPIMSLALLCSMASASADEVIEPAEIKRVPVLTNPEGSDPGTTESSIPELSEIVVLCATRPQSAEFKNQWAAYVRGNYKPGMNIDAVIDDVLRQADEYRARIRKGSKGPATAITQKPLNTKRMMHDTAKAIISNMRA